MHIVFPILLPLLEYVDIFYKEDIPYLNEIVCRFFYFPIAVAIVVSFLIFDLISVILSICLQVKTMVDILLN
jgi:hypothetical protein